MSLSPHQILMRLADGDRSKARDELASLARKKQSLQSQQKDVEVHAQQLLVQREEVLRNTAQASMLLMMNDAMTEQQQRLLQIQLELRQLGEQDAQCMKRWIAANQKCETHEKMQRADDKRESRKQDHRVQQQMDDMFSARQSREV